MGYSATLSLLFEFNKVWISFSFSTNSDPLKISPALNSPSPGAQHSRMHFKRTPFLRFQFFFFVFVHHVMPSVTYTISTSITNPARGSRFPVIRHNVLDLQPFRVTAKRPICFQRMSDVFNQVIKRPLSIGESVRVLCKPDDEESYHALELVPRNVLSLFPLSFPRKSAGSSLSATASNEVTPRFTRANVLLYPPLTVIRGASCF